MARRSPRARFATPFVVVLGCGRPPAPVEEPEVATIVPPADAALPIDADESPGAEVMDQATVEGHCSGRLRPVWNCNPPPPPPEPGPIDASPPSPTRARVLDAVVSGYEVVITIGRGTNDGIDQGWRGTLTDKAGKVLHGSAFVITAATERTSRARVKVTPDQVNANPYARLEPPRD